jgi:hypothetical protein
MLAAVLSVVVVAATAASAGLSRVAAAPFADVPDGAWYGKAVHDLAAAGIIEGMGSNRFDPDGRLTNAQAYAALSRAFGLDEQNASPGPFGDIRGHWAEGAVNALYAAGIVRGDERGNVNPDALLVRERIIVLLLRALGIPENPDAAHPFTDVPAGHWAERAIATAVQHGLTAGIGSGRFGLGEPVTRAELAVFLYKIRFRLPAWIEYEKGKQTQEDGEDQTAEPEAEPEDSGAPAGYAVYFPGPPGYQEGSAVLTATPGEVVLTFKTSQSLLAAGRPAEYAFHAGNAQIGAGTGTAYVPASVSADGNTVTVKWTEADAVKAIKAAGSAVRLAAKSYVGTIGVWGGQLRISGDAKAVADRIAPEAVTSDAISIDAAADQITIVFNESLQQDDPGGYAGDFTIIINGTAVSESRVTAAMGSTVREQDTIVLTVSEDIRNVDTVIVSFKPAVYIKDAAGNVYRPSAENLAGHEFVLGISAPATASLMQGTNPGTTKLIGVDGTMEYSLDGGITWLDIAGAEVDNLDRAAGDVILVRVKAANGKPAGEARTVTVTLPVIRPAPAPTTAVLAQGTNPGTTKLTGVDGTMEYSLDGGITWLDIAGAEVDNLDLIKGDIIRVRVKAANGKPAGEARTVTVTLPDIKPPLYPDVILEPYSTNNVPGTEKLLVNDLNPNTLEYRYSTDNGFTFSNWIPVPDNCILSRDDGGPFQLGHLIEVRFKEGDKPASSAIILTVSSNQ